MRAIIGILAAIALIGCKNEVETPVSMKDDVAFLASDSLKGRDTGTPYELMAAGYIQMRYGALGLEPKGAGGYYQTFSFTPSNDPHREATFDTIASDGTITGTNVIGYLDNQAETTVVIGAHYDHLGMGGEGSLHRGEAAIHNGADDNASGVAIMLNLAKKVQDSAMTKNNYLFIAFSGEELGLLGSNFFVKNPTIDLEKVTYMINMDMVGRLNEDKQLAVHGVGTSPIFKQTIFVNNNDRFQISEHESGVGPSDHTSFYLQDIPVLHFFTGQHEDYHKPGDDAEKLNYEGMESISGFILDLIKDLSTQGDLAFRKTKNESEEVPRFKVGLGVVPDYLYSGTGMCIDGVSEDRPAQKAGLIKGDIVIKMGDSLVTDMMSYMRALSSFEKGQSTKVTVQREGEEVTVDVEF
ncbi:M28 family peptidase [Gilvibacter sp.]|uniref:M28 family peptidase n=1 Tax=Gilvibacter sp. TaxID=2729997 RepID=UPI0025BF759B|nr:M28 family peptidase [Gilvibacter sp.]NQX76980.1 M28 family peptidase [Gilvibacter sp.]